MRDSTERRRLLVQLAQSCGSIGPIDFEGLNDRPWLAPLQRSTWARWRILHTALVGRNGRLVLRAPHQQGDYSETTA